MIKKRIIFTLLVHDNNFVLSRNFSLQTVGDLDWLINNYDFSNIASYIDELVILNIRNKKKNLVLIRFCQFQWQLKNFQLS